MDLLTTKEVTARLNRSNSTICRWVTEGKLTPAIKAPGLRQPMFFHPEDIEALEAELAEKQAS